MEMGAYRALSPIGGSFRAAKTPPAQSGRHDGGRLGQDVSPVVADCQTGRPGGFGILSKACGSESLSHQSPNKHRGNILLPHFEKYEIVSKPPNEHRSNIRLPHFAKCGSAGKAGF